MKTIITLYKCATELTLDQFKTFDTYLDLDEVEPLMEKAGATDLDWGGHFGEYIYFMVENLKDIKATEAVIKKLIELAEERAADAYERDFEDRRQALAENQD